MFGGSSGIFDRGGLFFCRIVAPPGSWSEETPEGFGQRLQKVVESINAKHDVKGLCKGWPKRLATVIEKEGDHIGK